MEVGEKFWWRLSVGIGLFVVFAGAVTALVWPNIPQVVGPRATAPTKEFFAAVAGIAGVTTGFVITAKTILLTLPDTKTTRRLALSGALPGMVSMMSLAAASSVAIGITSCALILLSGSPTSLGFFLVGSTWVGATAVAAVSFGRFLLVFTALSAQVARDRRDVARGDQRAQLQLELAELDAAAQVPAGTPVDLAEAPKNVT